MGSGQERQPVVEPVRRHEVRDAPTSQARPHGGQGRGVTEQHDLHAGSIDEPRQQPARGRRRPQEATRHSNDAVGLAGVERICPLPGRRENGDPVGRELADQRVEGPLDPTNARGEVVRDQQRPRDLHGRLSSQKVDAHRLEEQVDALDEGRAYVDGVRLRAVEVTGADAGGWLNDLVTAAVSQLAAATPREKRSAFLTPDYQRTPTAPRACCGP